jgi:hypothetical protein
MLPTLQAFMAAHRLIDITVVADAGMLSDNNKREIEAAGLGFILGGRIGHIPYVIDEWHRHNHGSEMPDGLVLLRSDLPPARPQALRVSAWPAPIAC